LAGWDSYQAPGLLSAVAVISDEVSNINEALLSADGGWSTA
jgi:hypothetical protein